MCILSIWILWEIKFCIDFWCLTCKYFVMWDPFSVLIFLLQTSWILSCSSNFLLEWWYLACHFVVQYGDVSPENVGQATMGWGLDLPATYHVFANCRTRQVSLRVHKDKRSKWDSGQPSSLATADAALENAIKDRAVVDRITIPCMKWTSVFSSCLPQWYLSDCLWKWSLSALTQLPPAANLDHRMWLEIKMSIEKFLF